MRNFVQPHRESVAVQVGDIDSACDSCGHTCSRRYISPARLALSRTCPAVSLSVAGSTLWRVLGSQLWYYYSPSSPCGGPPAESLSLFSTEAPAIGPFPVLPASLAAISAARDAAEAAAPSYGEPRPWNDPVPTGGDMPSPEPPPHLRAFWRGAAFSPVRCALLLHDISR